MLRSLFLTTLALLCCVPASASQSIPSLKTALQSDIASYLSARAKIEHLSAISLCVSLRGGASDIAVASGRTQYGGGVPVTPRNIFQIGSNTKAFTSAAILQLEAEGKLSIDQTVGRWLPQYPAWKGVTIRRLLSMTSGIPTYDDTKQMLADYARNPKRYFTIPELIAYVYPTNPNAPKPTLGYSYSNTNYLLAELIVEAASHDTYPSQLQKRFFSKLGLDSTFYAANQYAPAALAREPSAYFVNDDPDNAALAPLLGRDVRLDSLSWMQGAGGIAATPCDLAHWARQLYTGPMLPPKQRAELFSLVSTKTGKPLAEVSEAEPRGFGLGVARMMAPGMPPIWFYEGESLGFRTVQYYLTTEDVAVAFSFNSRPAGAKDDAGKLAQAVYKTLKESGAL
ncbi:MAG TPA: serine hydrolase domain-containing protein [Candidatus Cybelea sp.]|jgi:D-alanyl-D-alanine carboxypeptidase|nr:serine hydrolase domain-containing protein [Candidatus Cybelea sp.]